MRQNGNYPKRPLTLHLPFDLEGTAVNRIPRCLKAGETSMVVSTYTRKWIKQCGDAALTLDNGR